MGQRCMASDRPFHVCQLPDETRCAYNSECPSGQLCGVDGRCRDQCAADRDCVAEQVCSQGTCAEPVELTQNGKLPIALPEGGASEAAPTGQPCSFNSECEDPLVCRMGLCAKECLGDRDCPSGETCSGNRCKRPDAGGNVSNLPDAGNVNNTAPDGGADASGCCTIRTAHPRSSAGLRPAGRVQGQHRLSRGPLLYRIAVRRFRSRRRAGRLWRGLQPPQRLPDRACLRQGRAMCF